MKKKTKKKINIDFNNQDKALLGTFVALIILVAILGTIVLNLDEITKDDKEILKENYIEITTAFDTLVDDNAYRVETLLNTYEGKLNNSLAVQRTATIRQ